MGVSVWRDKISCTVRPTVAMACVRSGAELGRHLRARGHPLPRAQASRVREGSHYPPVCVHAWCCCSRVCSLLSLYHQIRADCCFRCFDDSHCVAGFTAERQRCRYPPFTRIHACTRPTRAHELTQLLQAKHACGYFSDSFKVKYEIMFTLAEHLSLPGVVVLSNMIIGVCAGPLLGICLLGMLTERVNSTGESVDGAKKPSLTDSMSERAYW